MLSELGINVVETDEAEDKDDSDEESTELVETTTTTTAVAKTTTAKEPADRTDDPVRMYLREMGTVELLSREGEIAIAKRIEAGRETMIAGLCESPLSFQAIIIWRDELADAKILLRDIIDLEATYAGPDAKNAPIAQPADAQNAAPTGAPGVAATPAPAPGTEQSAEGESQPVGEARPSSYVRHEGDARPSSYVRPEGEGRPTNEARADAEGRPEGEGRTDGEGRPNRDYDDDDDDLETNISSPPWKPSLSQGVVETFDRVAATYKKLRRLQDQLVDNRLKNERLSPAQERRYKKHRGRGRHRRQIAVA